MTKKGSVPSRPQSKTKLQISASSVDGSGVRVDLSFLPLHVSVKHGRLNNRLLDEKEFAEKVRNLREFLHQIYNKKFSELRTDFYHYHALKGEDRELAIACIKTAIRQYQQTHTYNIDIEQLLGNEELIQLGTTESDRYIGIYQHDNNTFLVLLLDYHHHIRYDQRRNTINTKNLTYSLQ